MALVVQNFKIDFKKVEKSIEVSKACGKNINA